MIEMSFAAIRKCIIEVKPCSCRFRKELQLNLTAVLQIIVALGLLNVWLLRYSKTSVYRGGQAKNFKEEFAAYGLPGWFLYFIGALKIGSAIALLAGLWIHSIVLGAAVLVCLLMLGALAMHIKVKDPVGKSVPALVMLLMSATIVATSV